MSYIIDRTIMSYIEEERARCAALVVKLARGADKSFLIHCINFSVQPSATEDRRTRFDEMSADEGIEDLL